MSTPPATIAFPMLLDRFEQSEVLPPFKIIEHYWDCCIIGYAIQKVLRQVGRLTILAATELIKFGIVLFMAYLFGLGIFQLWDGANLQTDERSNESNGYDANSSEQRGTYPYVVEVPSKTSQDSFKQRKSKDKTRRSTTIKDEQLEDSSNNTRKSSISTADSPRTSLEVANT